MRQRGLVMAVLVVIVLATSLASLPSQAQDWSEPGCAGCKDPAKAGKYVPGELLVRFQPWTPKAGAARVISAQGATYVREIEPLEIHLLRLPPGQPVEEAVARFEKRPEVKYAEPNYIRHITVVDDPGLANQWAPQRIEAPAAWALVGEGPEVVIAVIDTGIDYGHPELAPNMWQNPDEIPGNGIDDDGSGKVDDVIGWDFVNLDNDPQDDHSHGTHVAGSAAADDNTDPDGLVGICPNCRLMAVKVFDSNGEASDDDFLEGIGYAVAQGAQVINISAGDTIPSEALEDAVDAAWAAGSLIVAGAGNNGSDQAFYPAAYTNAIAVASTGSGDLRSSFSNYDTKCHFVDVAAPGEDIYSTIPLPGDPDPYGYKSGTSMATPHAAGLAGLIFYHFPDEDHAWVRRRLEGTSDDQGPTGRDAYYGWGRINAYRALTDPEVPPSPPPPSMEPLVATSVTATGYGHARKLARDAGGTLHLAWHAQQEAGYQILYSTSDDEGTTWDTPTEVFSDPAETYHPALALDGDYVYIAFPSKAGATTYRTLFMRKPLSAGSWPSPPVALTEDGYDAVRPDLYLEPASGKLHMVASSLDNAPTVAYRSSSDQGDTWLPDPAVMVNPNDPDYPACIGDTRYAAVHAYQDNVYIAARTVNCMVPWPYPPPDCLLASLCTQTARSTDGGATWPDSVDGEKRKQYLSEYLGVLSGEYGLSLAGVADRLYLAYEYGSGVATDGGVLFRQWNPGSAWSDPEQISTTGHWPTVSQASSGQAWMMWEDGGSLKLRHYTGTTWESTETLVDSDVELAANFPNLKLDVDDGQLAWVYTACYTPWGLRTESRSLVPTAVELADFRPTPGADGITLEWQTAQETTTVGFHLYRAASGPDGEPLAPPERLNKHLIPVKSPGSPTGASYTYLDESAEAGIGYQYWLDVVDVNGQATRHGPVSGSLLGAGATVYLPLVHK